MLKFLNDPRVYPTWAVLLFCLWPFVSNHFAAEAARLKERLRILKRLRDIANNAEEPMYGELLEVIALLDANGEARS